MFTLQKSERLCNFYLKQRLFSEGQRLFVFPFGVTYLVWPKDTPIFLKQGESTETVSATNISLEFVYPCKIMVAAPKRLFKKATRRNRVRRLVKEAYRKNKLPFYAFLDENNLNCLMSVVYSSPNVLPFAQIEEKMVNCLTKLCDAISNNFLDNNC